MKSASVTVFFRPVLVIFAALSLLSGVLYPLAVTGIAQVVFPEQAAGSLRQHGDRVVGSAFIGQTFTAPGYFWSRPSATGPEPYNAAASSGSNQGPGNPALHAAVRDRAAALRAASPTQVAPVPVDLVTTSASGLDPEISIAAARWQASRVAAARGVPETEVLTLIEAHAQRPLLGFLGEPRVNVLALNLALDDRRKP